MKVVDRKWTFGTYKAFEGTTPDMLAFEPGCRVQPAPFLGRPDKFYLIARYEPGQSAFFPKGGFEVRGEGSARHSFELDQVVVWSDKTTKKAVARPKPAEKKARTRVKVTKVAAPAPEAKKLAPAAKKAGTTGKVCGFLKKDGKPCQMRTDGSRCRHHR